MKILEVLARKKEYGKWLIYLFAAAALLYFLFTPGKLNHEEVPNNYGVQGIFTGLPVEKGVRPGLKPTAVPLNIDASSVLAIDIKTGIILFEKKSEERRAPASLAKLMTALVVINTLPLNATTTVEKVDPEIPYPRMELLEGEVISIYNLVQGMLVESDNDAAYELARVVAGSPENFSSFMDSMAKQLKLKSTKLVDPAGLDTQGQFTTAKDLLTLTAAFLSHEELSHIVQIQRVVVYSADGKIKHTLDTSNKLLSQKNILGVKTGFTDLARGNLILLASNDSNDQILTIVLGSENREKDSEKLLNWIFDSYDF